MGNLNITLDGYINKILEAMINRGYAKSKTEAIRLALFEFNREYKIIDKEDKELDNLSFSISINSMKEYFNDSKEDKAWNKYL